MATEADIEDKFWETLKSDRTVMLGLADSHHAQPMTAQTLEDDDRGSIFFFTSKENDLVATMGQSHAAALHLVAKNHSLFATADGELAIEADRAMIDRLWNPFVAAWFEGKQDPKLVLLRFEPRHGQVWLNESSLLAGVRVMLGRDPKREYKDKVAHLDLDQGRGTVN